MEPRMTQANSDTEPPADSAKSKRNARRVVMSCLLWTVLGLAMHVFAPTFNVLKLSGLPAGYWFAAQGAPLVLAALANWLTSGKGPEREVRN